MGGAMGAERFCEGMFQGFLEEGLYLGMKDKNRPRYTILTDFFLRAF